MEKKLYDACLKGDVEMLEALMREDELTLARVSISSCINQTPLHLASMLGHFEFAKSLVSYKPDFASRLDSQGRSPLHLASANGYAKIVKLLVEKDSSMCSVTDEDERTPLHLAVMNGQNECVSELIKVGSIYDQEETVILHLCILYNRLKVLILIIESIDQDLLNIKDDKGNTVLHSATSLRRMQIIKYLVTKRSEVDVNEVNGNGLTVLDVIEEMPKDAKTMEIKDLLVSAGALRTKEFEAVTTSLPIPEAGGGVADDKIEAAATTDGNGKLGNIWKKAKTFTIFGKKKEKGDKSLLVAASVIAAMAYQAAISPPGGVATMDATEAPSPSPLKNPYVIYPSYSLLAYFNPSFSDAFWISNTISFIAALSVIFLYVSGSSLKRPVFIWLLRAAMWITLSSMAFAYVIAVRATIPSYWSNKTAIAISCGIISWVGLISLALLVIVYLLVRYITVNVYRLVRCITVNVTVNVYRLVRYITVNVYLTVIKMIRYMRRKKKNEADTLPRTPKTNIV